MIIDIILLILLLISAIYGYKKGFTKIFIKFAALILALVLGFLLQGPLANHLYEKTSLGNNIEKNISTVVQEKINVEKTEDSFISIIVKEEDLKEGTDKVSHNITMIVLKGISFVSIVVVVYIICFILESILNIVVSLPILGTVNKFAGLGVGIIQALIKLWVVFAIILFIEPLIGNNFINNMISQSYFTKFLYQNNLLVSLLKSTFKI